MAEMILKKIKSHENIYATNKEERYIRTEIGIPDHGVNMKTGMLVLVPGYGANMDSHVWKRMRSEFCDQYNLITVQCDYFGNKHMMPEHYEVAKEIPGINDDGLKSVTLIYERETDETIKEFNDMGIMQALDIVSATLGAIYELNERGYSFDFGKIILFGISHGAYLSYLANAICPELYSCILDISSYISPYYLERPRVIIDDIGKIKTVTELSQLINKCPEYKYKKNLYDLGYLYNYIENTCNIIVFQGEDDWMVTANEKIEFANQIQHTEVMLIHKDEVDGQLFTDANHGLGVNFFVLFEMLMPMLESIFVEKQSIQMPDYLVIGEADARMEISYTSGLPKLQYISQN